MEAELVRFQIRQLLDLADHVIAKIAEQARGHRRQPGRHRDPAFLDKRAQGLQGRCLLRHELVRLEAGVAVDLGLRCRGSARSASGFKPMIE